MSNVNAQTGIRFGVIALNSLCPDVVTELLHGEGAVDISYKEAYELAGSEARAQWSRLMEEAEIAAAETDYHMTESERESFIESWLSNATSCTDETEFVEQELESFSDQYPCDDSCIEGVYEGVTYAISSLGGAGLLWSYDGPQGYVDRLCSPCVPGAADLDSGFTLMSEEFDHNEGGFIAHCIPRDWLAKEI